MKSIPAFLKQLFHPKELHDLDLNELLGAMSDPAVRKVWLTDVFNEMQRVNLEVDARLVDGVRDVSDLSARRQALQFVLESISSARRRVRNPNPKAGSFDLSSVTVQPV